MKGGTTMYDLNHDGNEDYWDDVFYLEEVERESHSLDNPDSYDLDGEVTGRSSSTSTRKTNYRSTTPVRQSTGVPFVVRMIIACIVISVVGAFSELLGFIVLAIWIMIEINTK